EYNYIKKCLNDLNNAFRGCIDVNIIEATKAYIQEKILRIFTSLPTVHDFSIVRNS
ncbi:hypothetical protein GNF67_15140, partial [Clostridium perfringens]|nr:hypothetical protein [Clostridium perfringens]